jgi:hypothetical protein
MTGRPNSGRRGRRGYVKKCITGRGELGSEVTSTGTERRPKTDWDACAVCVSYFRGDEVVERCGTRMMCGEQLRLANAVLSRSGSQLSGRCAAFDVGVVVLQILPSLSSTSCKYPVWCVRKVNSGCGSLPAFWDEACQAAGLVPALPTLLLPVAHHLRFEALPVPHSVLRPAADAPGRRPFE